MNDFLIMENYMEPKIVHTVIQPSNAFANIVNSNYAADGVFSAASQINEDTKMNIGILC